MDDALAWHARCRRASPHADALWALAAIEALDDSKEEEENGTDRAAIRRALERGALAGHWLLRRRVTHWLA